MKLKTLRTEGQRTKEVCDLGIAGDHLLYPDNTKRTIISYFLFPKTLNGERRRGLQIIEQKALTDKVASCMGEGTVHYNYWISQRFVDYQFIESKLEMETNP